DGSNPSAAIVQSASDVQCSRLLKTTAAPGALAGLSQTYVFKKKETACPAVRSCPPPSAKAYWRCRTPRMS
ncbi:hypothetical protein EGK63_13140, partial [Brevundimonas sp. 357]